MKQANIVFMFPECMSNVLKENTKTIERFYQGYQTRKKYQKWKNAALAIQSFYRLKKRDHKRLFTEKKETDSELNQTKQTTQKLVRCSYLSFLLFFTLSFFLASFIVSCILLSMFRINKTHYHIFWIFLQAGFQNINFLRLKDKALHHRCELFIYENMNYLQINRIDFKLQSFE